MSHHHFFPAAKSDVPPVVPADADESRPEPAPRSKPPTVTPKPPHQANKPQLGPRSSGPLSPSSPTSPRPSSSYVTGRWWNRDATDQTSSVSERQQRDNRDLLLHTTHSVNSYSLCVDMKTSGVIDLCLSDDSPEAPAATRGPLPAPRLKRAPSEQERESTSSNPAAPPSPQDG